MIAVPHISDLDVAVYSKGFEFLQPLTNLQDGSDFTPKHNGKGSATLVLAPDADVNEYLQEDGARIVAQYRGEHLLSGMIRSDAGSITPNGDLTYTVEDDYRVLENTLAWVAPQRPLLPAALAELGQAWQTGPAGTTGTTTGQSGHFVWPAGVDSAEAMIKHIAQENFTRIGRDVTVLPNLDRGGDARAGGLMATLTPRNGSLAEEVAPILEWSGLGLRVWQEPRGDGLLLDVYEPDTWPTELDYASGAIPDGSFERHRPTATRMVVGGPGEGPDRAFYSVVDADLEAQQGDIIEQFVDATGASLEWPESLSEAFRVAKYYLLRSEVSTELKNRFTAYLDAAGRKKLAENVAVASIAAALAETEAFSMYGPDGLRPGDLVPIATPAGPIVERITSATLALSNGLTVTPTLGEMTADEDEAIWEAIAAIAAGFRRLSRSM